MHLKVAEDWKDILFSFYSIVKVYQRPVTPVRTFFQIPVITGKHLNIYLKYFRIYRSLA